MPNVEPAKNLPGYGPILLEPGELLDPAFIDLSGYSTTSHNHNGVYQPLATVLTNTTASYTTALDTKLGGIATGATANATDAQLRDRSTHTGTQAWSTLTGTPTTVAGYGITDAAAAYTASLVVPTTGQTQTFTTTKADQIIACNHVATIAAQTFVFPTDANSRIGQELRIFSRSIITTVTLTLNSNTIIGTALTTLPANGNVAWIKVGASTWARTQ